MNKVTVVAVVLTFFASDFGRRHVAKAQNDTLEVIDEDFCDNCTITHTFCEYENSPDQCCSTYPKMPSHGENDLGCCINTEFGCCPDDLTPAKGPFSDGCNCEDSEYGCCPDGQNSAIGINNEGCGCQYSEFGCCPDLNTPAQGQNFTGCPCDTQPNGCCMDGVTNAQGPNLEGCECNETFGCCPDGVTPKTTEDEECGCESTIWGCCPDQETPALGPLFEGCSDRPDLGKCHMPPVTGTLCLNYTVKWFYDTKYSGCSQFWYGGCDAGPNHFDEEIECQNECVNPKGPLVCFLRKNPGSCTGIYNEWYFDMDSKTCAPFIYSGCLGNGNRFLTKESCEGMCTPQEGTELCMKPKVEGSCYGNFTRYYYDKELGRCQEFSFSGCNGNNNRFATMQACENACRHVSKLRKTEIVCNLPISEGSCDEILLQTNSTIPKWTYDNRRRRCVPFYFTGCGGNENIFDTKSDCEDICPTTFPPIIRLPGGSEVLAKRGSRTATLYVSIRANPPANVQWFLKGRQLSKLSSRYTFTDDFLKIDQVSDLDAGTYTIKAENGIGANSNLVNTANIDLIVYPLFPSLKIKSEKTLFLPGEEAVIKCEIRGYPPPKINWFKISHDRGIRTETPMLEQEQKASSLFGGSHFSVETFHDGIVNTISQLIIRNLTLKDSGGYKCETTSETGIKVADTEGIRVDLGPGSECVDVSTFSCEKIVEHKFCGNKYYGQYCCLSCTKAGFIPRSGEV